MTHSTFPTPFRCWTQNPKRFVFFWWFIASSAASVSVSRRDNNIIFILFFNEKLREEPIDSFLHMDYYYFLKKEKRERSLVQLFVVVVVGSFIGPSVKVVNWEAPEKSLVRTNTILIFSILLFCLPFVWWWWRTFTHTRGHRLLFCAASIQCISTYRFHKQQNFD